MPNLNYQTLRREIENVETLPTLPGILNRLLRVIENPRISLKEIGNFISNDPVLTTRILRAVNSPIYGFPGRIASINQSLVLLGLNVVRGLLLGVSVFEAMKKGMEGLWEHSVGCATVARILAQRVGLKDPEEVAVAALLHDIGKVILGLRFPREYREVQEDVAQKRQFISEGETDFFEVTHAEIGSWIAQRWHFPLGLIEIIACHHQPQSSRQAPRMTAVVHLADILIRARGFGFSGDAFVPAVSPQVWETLQLSAVDLKGILGELEDALDMADDLLVLN